MKKLITYLKALWSLVADSQSTDVSVDRRLTVGSPSFHRRSTMLKLVSVLVLILTIGSGNVWGTVSGSIATSISAGDQIVIVNTGEANELTGVSSNIGQQASYSTAPAGTYILTVEAGKSGSGYSFKDGSNNYLAYTKAKGTTKNNNLFLIANPSGTDQNKQCSWTVSIDGSTKVATITNVYNTDRSLKFNSDRFCCYTSAQTAIKIFKIAASTPTITPSVAELDWGTVNKGAVLTTKTFTITGANLTSAALVYSASGGYSVSPSGKAGAAGSLASQTLTVTPPSTATPGTYNSTVSITGGGLASAVTVAVKLTVQQTDEFIDEVHSSTGYEPATPHIEAGSYGTTPVLTDKATLTSGTCEQVHYHFVGWITSAKYEAGTAIAVGDLQTPTSATGATYYAVWAKQAAGGGGTTTKSYGWETADDASYWTISGVEAYDTYVKTGSKSGKIARGSTGESTVQFKNKVNVTSFSFQFLRQTTNNNYNVRIETSSDGSTWDDVENYNMSEFTSKETWYAKSHAFDGTKSLYVRFVCYTSTAIRWVDDVSITYSGGVSYDDYIAKCCTPLGTISGSVSLSQLASPNPTKLKATWTMTAETGIASYTLEVYDNSDNLVKTINNYTSGDEITGLNPCTTYYVKLYTVSSGTVGLVTYCDGGLISTSSSVTTNGYTYTINPVNVSLKDGETEATNSCEDFMAEYVADAGYDLPTTISVTGASSYTWEDGVLMIDKADVTGNVTVTITGTAQSNFINGETVFIQADSKDYSAWKDDACVKAWFNNNWSGGSAETTYWLFDATDTDAGKKLFATVVPASGDLNIVQLQRFAGNCSDKWNDNGSVNKASSNGVNTFRSYGSADNNVAWNGSSTILYLYGSQNSWESSLGTFADQGAGVWTATISNYAPDATSKDYKIKTSYNNGWIGNTGSNNNATLSGMIVGSTYNVTATLNVTDHSLVMSKTFVKGEVSFDLQGHGSAISKLTNVAAGSKISAPSPAPSATGWDFGGWFKEPACTNEWNFASDEVDETMTLYAKWTKHTYTITSTLNNCSSSPAIPSSYEYTGSAAGLSYTITPSSGYRLPTTITVTGTTHTWDPATGALVLTGTITNNVTITISAVQTHTVDWYVGGSAPANKIGDDGQTTVVDHGGKIEDFPATTPDGTPCDKTFVGWTNTTSYTHGTSLLFTDVAGSPTINADASFYAVFATGGSDDFELVTAVSQLHVGDVVTIANFVGNSESGAVIKAYNSGNNWPKASASTDASGKISGSTTDMQTFTLEEGSVDDTWAFNDGTGYPYAASSGSNYMKRETTLSGNSSFSITIDGTSHAAAIVAQGTYTRNTMRYNSGSSIFSCYDPVNSQSDIYIYRKPSATGHTITCADCGTSVTPTYTASPTGGTVSVTKSASPVTSGSTVKTCTAVDLTVTLTPATHYDLTGFKATGLTTGTATITPAVGSTLPVSVAQTFTVTVSAGATGTLTLAPTFTAQTPLSITLETHSKGTFTPIGDVYSGESFTFPTVTPSDAECSSFLGWIEGTTWSGDGTETDPTAITGLANYHAAGSSSGTLTTTKTYTAVFGEKDTQETTAYVKVAAAPADWSGDYLIVRDDNSRAFDGSLSTLDAADNYIGVTITAGTIVANSTVNASKWTIAKVGETSNYTIKSASGYYIGRTGSTNGLNSSTSDQYTNTLSYSSDHVVITSSGGPTLQMNGGTRFRYYASSQQELQLYKLGTAQMITYTYTTNPACTPRYRVTVNSAVGGSPEADKTYEHADETITITANPAAGYSFTSWTITKTTGGDNVTSTLLTGDKPTTANTTFTMPAYDITIAATYTKKMVSTLEVKDGATVVSTTTGPVSGTVNISTGANKTLDVVITPSDAYDHSWTATVSAGSTYASITNVTDDGFRVNGLAQGDATITVNAPNDGSAKSVTLTVQVRDIMPEEIILKRDGSNTPIETLIMYYDETNSKGQYVKVNVGYSPANPTNKAFTFSSALTGKVGSHSHAPASGYEVLVANGVTSDAVNCTFTSSADGSVTKVLAVTVLPILSDRFVDYVHGNATQTVSARLSDDRYSIIPDINTPSLSDASDANPTSEDCETSHYHLVGWLPQTTADALWAAGTPITDATEGLVRAGESVEATGQTWCAIWAEEQ